ncbi:MAG: AMP-dependent synthetase, partial [Dehalococcoidia bacterium]|nr:AMP-dependent synthetase [Dehalococcoidia bacterium]
MHGGVSVLPGLLNGADAAKQAIVVPDGPSVTYGALRERMERNAGLLRAAGVTQGQVVSLVQPNDLSCVEAFLAVTRAGAIAAPLNPAYTADEHRSFMEDARAGWAIVDASIGAAWQAAKSLTLRRIVSRQDARGLSLERDGAPLVRTKEAALPQPGDVALFLHTSGTTSRPKGVPLTHANLCVSAGNTARTYALTPGDTTLAVMPLFHVHGLVGVVLATLLTGGTVVLPPRFSASAFWPAAAKHRVTWYSSSPTIHQVLLLRADQDAASRGAFRFVRSCSAALAPVVLEQYEARFDVPVVEAYGMTEASHQIASNPLPPAVRRPGTVGQGTGVEIAVL